MVCGGTRVGLFSLIAGLRSAGEGGIAHDNVARGKVAISVLAIADRWVTVAEGRLRMWTNPEKEGDGGEREGTKRCLLAYTTTDCRLLYATALAAGVVINKKANPLDVERQKDRRVPVGAIAG